MIWSPEIDDKMRGWIKEGLSASEIGDRLGCSRNAVLGRRFRVGITADDKPPAPPKSFVPRLPRDPKPPKEHKARGRFASGLDHFNAYPEDVVLETFSRVEAGMSRYQAAKSMGVSHQNLRPKLWYSRYPILAERAKWIGAERRMQLEAWLEAGKALDEERQTAKIEAIAAVNAAVLPMLNERTQEIVHRKIAGETLESIGASLGITRERVRQLCMKAMLKGAAIPGLTLSESAKKTFGTKPRDPITGKRKNNWPEKTREAHSERMKARWARFKEWEKENG